MGKTLVAAGVILALALGGGVAHAQRQADRSAALGPAARGASLPPLMERGAADSELAPISVMLTEEAARELAAGDAAAATATLEAALAADPRNTAAWRLLGEAAEARGLPGLALKHYREAARIDPRDRAALERAGQVLAQRGARIPAEEALARLEAVCPAPCLEADRLRARLAQPLPAPAPPAATAQTGAQTRASPGAVVPR